MICVSLARGRTSMMRAEHQKLADDGVGLVELRLDWLTKPDVPRLLKDRPTPVVVTCRREEDGGKWRGDEGARLTLLRTAIIEGAEYVDLELDVAPKIPRYGDTKRVVSHHDFTGTPSDEALAERHAVAAAADADVIKLVTMATRPADNLQTLGLMRRAAAAATPVPTVAFCMGPSGLVSRYLAGRNGAPWTYASFSGGRTLAPGMVSYEQLRAWRYDAVGPDTRLFAVLGDPIAQSLSPAVHNAAIEDAGLDAAYVPILLPKDEFEEGVETLAEVGFGGFSVTIPHKEAALAWADSRDPAATRIGAANTLVRGEDGKWTASNTDLPAALSSLVDAMRTTDPAATLERKTALVLGAGGVTRAVASGLMDAGAAVTICGRTAEKTAALAEELGCVSVTWENRSARQYDIVVNGTPVGMHPEPDAAPLPENAVADGAVVFDTIYNPENTLLLKRARARGAATVSGVEMFVRQAAAQFRAFHDVDPPVEVMREAFRRGISAVKR